MLKTKRGNEQVSRIAVHSSLNFCIIIGCLLFCRGYLLNRKVITEKSTYEHKPAFARTSFRKTIFVLVDALRFDFLDRMKFISQKLNSNCNDCAVHACPFKFMADPPTTTMQRLKALMTGTLPTFIDVSSNFNSYRIEEDSLIYQFYKAGFKIGFMGDDTWLSLFDLSYFSAFAEGHPSFNAWDLDTVDRAVNSSLYSILSNTEESMNTNWDVIITHYLGVDHCGHRYGPNHKEMERKLAEIDATIQFIYNGMSPDTLLIVFGDHGMTDTGDHGGDSTEEVQSAVIFFTKDNSLKCRSNIKDPMSVSQIDLVPTVAAIMHIPIPFSSVGRVIANLLPDDTFTEAIVWNVNQVHKYVKAYSFGPNMQEIEYCYQRIVSAYTTFKMYNTQTKTAMEELNKLSAIYLDHVKEIAVGLWTQFNAPAMTCGLAVCLSSMIAVLFSLKNGLENSKTSVRQIIQYGPLVSLLASCIVISLSVPFSSVVISGLIISAIFVFVVGHAVLNYRMLFEVGNSEVADTLSLLLYVFTCLGVLSNSFVINEGYILAFTLVMSSLLHLLLFKPTAAPATAYTRRSSISESELAKNNVKFVRFATLTSWVSWFSLVLIVRLSFISFRCREELTSCTEEFLLHKHLTSLPNEWVVHKFIIYSMALVALAVLVVLVRTWMRRKKCLLSARPCALIGKYIPSVLVVLVCVHWALQGLFDQIMHLQLRPLLQYFPMVFQAIAFGSLLVVWWKPLCSSGISQRIRNSNSSCRVLQSQKRGRKYSLTKPHISLSGTAKRYQDSYSQRNGDSHHLLDELQESLQADEVAEVVHSASIITYGTIVTLLLVHVTSIGLAPVVSSIPFAIASLLTLHDRFSRPDCWAPVVSWALVSQYFFYATGHQPIFSTIPWDSAFIAEDGFAEKSSFGISWIKPAIAVMSNIHVSQIIFSATLPLLVFWKDQSTKLDKLEARRKLLLDVSAKYLLLHGFKLLGCMLCVTIHRRHLMVWKIFTPKFIYEGVSFVVVYFVTYLSVLFVIRIDYLLEDLRKRKSAAIVC